MRTRLTELETAVLEMLLEGAGPALEPLRSQLGSLEVRSREWTGVGFVTEVEVPSNTPEASEVPLKGTVGDLVADIPGLAGGVGFLVHVASGRLTALEGHTYGGPWPESVPVTTLRYVDPRERDLSGLAVDPGPRRAEGGGSGRSSGASSGPTNRAASDGAGWPPLDLACDG